MSYTFDDSTQAAIPGKLEITKNKFLDVFCIFGIRRIFYTTIFSLSDKTLVKYFRKNKMVNVWISLKEHFQHGCVNPAIVLDKNKGLIATFTNLSNSGNGSVPVIKITKHSFELLKHKPLNNSDKIPVVACYYRNEENPYANAWADFDPKIPYTFSTDVGACDALLNQLKPSTWECLGLGLQQIENLSKEGLYYVELDEDLVNSGY